jgi:hypothetical protein
MISCAQENALKKYKKARKMQGIALPTAFSFRRLTSSSKMSSLIIRITISSPRESLLIMTTQLTLFPLINQIINKFKILAILLIL